MRAGLCWLQTEMSTLAWWAMASEAYYYNLPTVIQCLPTMTFHMRGRKQTGFTSLLGGQGEQWGQQSLGGSATPVYVLGCAAEFSLTSSFRGVSRHHWEYLEVKAALLGILEVRVAPRGKWESLRVQTSSGHVYTRQPS